MQTVPLKMVYLLMMTVCLQSHVYAGDRLLATGGVSQIEGAAGGGLMPWAVISGYGTDQQIGGAAFYTHARTRDGYTLDTGGLSVGIHNRIELSASHAKFSLADTVPGENIRLNTLGVKVRLFGDAIYDQDRWWPQVSAGMQYKYNEDYDFVPRLIGAQQRSGVDFYLAASKLLLGGLHGYNVLLNANLQASKANQFGILGFGGDKRDSYRLLPAVSAALMLQDNWLIGSEYRAKPDNLSAFKEDDAYDVFMTWFPQKNISVTGAYIDLGNIANQDNQTGWYLSGQVSY